MIGCFYQNLYNVLNQQPYYTLIKIRKSWAWIITFKIGLQNNYNLGLSLCVR